MTIWLAVLLCELVFVREYPPGYLRVA